MCAGASRAGFKAGALKAGLEVARGEFVAIFDADFIPRPGFPAEDGPASSWPIRGVGMVQTRWEHLNADYSLLTRTQAMALDGHFVIEQAVRNKAGLFINFNGTAGIWRRIVHRGRRQLAGRHADRRPRPELPCPAARLAVHVPERRDLARGAPVGDQRAEVAAVPLDKGRDRNGPEDAARGLAIARCR